MYRLRQVRPFKLPGNAIRVRQPPVRFVMVSHKNSFLHQPNNASPALGSSFSPRSIIKSHLDTRSEEQFPEQSKQKEDVFLSHTESTEFGAKQLSQLTKGHLLLLSLMSLITSSKTLLKLAIILLKRSPAWLIKGIVYPIYCGGETYGEVLTKGRFLFNLGFRNMMISYTVEDAEGSNKTTSSIEQVDCVRTIIDSIERICLQHNINYASISKPPSYVALKPTGLVPNAAEILKNYQRDDYQKQWRNYLDVCRSICSKVKLINENNPHQRIIICFDAEKRDLQDGVYAAQTEMMRLFNTEGPEKLNVIGTIQMYLTDSLSRLNKDIQESITSKNRYWVGYKLVRGAYIDSEPFRDTVIHKTKADTDNNYDTAIELSLKAIANREMGHLVIAGHNEQSIKRALDQMNYTRTLRKGSCLDSQVVFAQLMGMADEIGMDLSNKGEMVIKYVPWGPVEETREYLLRRLNENEGAVRNLKGISESIRYFSLAVKKLFHRSPRISS